MDDNEKVHKVILKQKLIKWFNYRLQKANKQDDSFTSHAGYLVAFILIVEMFFVVPGISTGLGIFIDYAIITCIYLSCIVLAKRVVCPFLKFFYIKYFTFLIVTSVALLLQSFIITKQIHWNTFASMIFSVAITVTVIIFAITVSYLWNNRKKWTGIVILLYLSVIVASIFLVKQEQMQLAAPITEPELLYEILVEQQSEYVYTPIHLQQNPAAQGAYKFTHIHYNSSQEVLVAEQQFNQQNELVSIQFPSVDGSNVLIDWSWAKEMYWGFSESDISISGDLWIPEGNGPFPIVYIMHGNHISESDSSIGYTYLGELLASNGYIVISIDANFLNFSVWSGIVDNDMVLRAWLYLAHIDSFYNGNILPIDWSNVALIGHSRGGQAAAMALDIGKWIENDDRLAVLDNVNINAIIGIAPTDYAVDKKLPYLNKVNYLTIHGTLDSDLTEFFGERQYERTQLTDQYFKGSVIIYGANHGQFNETWGKYDDQFPAALLLNTEQIVDEQAQQLAAKVYINGFLRAVFESEDEYRQLFQDPRVAQNFLPVAGYVTQYEDHHMDYYYSFDSEHKIEDISSSPLVSFETVELKGRNGSSKYNDVLNVSWKMGYSKLHFVIDTTGSQKAGRQIEAFVFQVAKREPSLKVEHMTNMNMEIDFITSRTLSRINLNNSFSLLDPYYPTYLKLDFLEDDIKKGKYEPKEEPYLQTYIIPIEMIKNHVQGESEWISDELTAINFWFKDKSGAILIDDIGVIYEGGSYVKYKQ